MTPERWRQVEEIYYAAVEREPAERTGFLEQACKGDSDLRKNVQTLLNAKDRHSAFLDAGALEAGRAIAVSLQQSLIGRQIGPYDVLALLGSGGMGEVYRASDVRLGRDVAIKILPAEFSQDAERLRRFEQEARTAGMLSHPNVLIVHDVGVHEETPYIVSELLEGETLRERLARGALPFRQGVDYALQVARGLAAAHEKGVIHRDLKPENLFVTNEGLLKILDFGLAKLKRRRVGGVDTDASNVPATETGMVLGTVGYMSPEQARGQEADHRSDIFSFGAILYEILTGTRAFQGASDVEVLHAILKHDPPDVQETQRRWSPGLDRILRRCLEKDPRSRFQSANDLAFAIETLARVSEDSGAPVMHAPASMGQAGRKRTAPFAWIATGLLAVALAVTIAVLYFRTPAAAPEMRVEISTPPTTNPTSFAISPDGRRLVFQAVGSAGQQLWLRSLDTPVAAPIAGTEGAIAPHPFWSPDSRSIGFFAGGKLKRIDVSGGLPQTLADAPDGLGGTWSAEGVILFSPSTNTPLFRVQASGGEVSPVTKLDAPRQTNHGFPFFLPGGRQFLFYALGELRGTYVGSLDSRETKRLTEAESAGAYLGSGWLLFVRQRSLMAQRLDLGRTELTGDPVVLADQVRGGGFGVGAFSVSAGSTLAYRVDRQDRRQLIWFDRSGTPLGTLGDPDVQVYSSPELSRDGHSVVFSRPIQNNADIWRIDAGRASRLTFDPAIDGFAVWSPDGRSIVFSSNRTHVPNLYQKPSATPGGEQLLLQSTQTNVPVDWSRDGRFILYYYRDPKTDNDLWVLPLGADRKPRPFVNTAYDQPYGQFSPDGHWVAYSSNESGRYEIYVVPFPEPGLHKWPVSTSGGVRPRWRSDGKELYYIAPDGRLMAVPIAVSGSTFKPGTPVALFQTRIVGGGTNVSGQQYDVAPDGRFLINTSMEDAGLPITLLLNWKPPAK
jgi:eukaryotic-like serine/threonine-protein kinase